MNRLWIIIRRIIQKFPARTSTGTKKSLTRPTFWVPTTAVVSRWWRESTTCAYMCVCSTLNQRVSCRVVYPIHVTQRADSGDRVKVMRGGETRNLFALRSSNSPLHQTQSRRPRLFLIFYYNRRIQTLVEIRGGNSHNNNSNKKKNKIRHFVFERKTHLIKTHVGFVTNTQTAEEEERARVSFAFDLKVNYKPLAGNNTRIWERETCNSRSKSSFAAFPTLQHTRTGWAPRYKSPPPLSLAAIAIASKVG